MKTNNELWTDKVEELLDVALEAQKLRAQMNRLEIALDRLLRQNNANIRDLSATVSRVDVEPPPTLRTRSRGP